MRLKPIWLWLLGLLFLLSLTAVACRPGSKMSSVGVVGYNHTDTTIVQFVLDGGGGESFIRAHRGGGSTSCCTSIPDRWHPGYEVAIEWTTDLENFKQKVVAVPEYDARASRMAVHFLRNGDVKIFVTSLSLGHPDYPLTGPEAGLNEGEDPIRDEWRNQGRKS
ncbi:DUF3304 domain-containing protein [Pseudomonas carnis]|uniref:DUF3304 domain-containing protein n=1 Tax=Pseudomonas TaxID=286 RepID=UPI00092FEDF0|nr:MULTISPECIES: DUF3304 domain-containing protein [Pseudomonas]MDN5482922.1 DUF3304 domain-containing protein [Pseudomonas sp.]MBA6041757.1 DUF3304 domain-containing protein [Pseudomonas lactis]MBH3465212.1 DUF3304 domain-containing protein [Pseudomonas carnis]MBK3470362.1 DUF3304 domain-containing protein [Pseudomonas carnis]MBN1083593.1 DUF3304 domain-containing protein [Pseudomonas sp. 1079]